MKIRNSIFPQFIINKIKNLWRKIALRLEINCIVLKFLLIYGWRKSRRSKGLLADNIIIVGGELFNKGAQAMVFTAVDRLSRRFPNKHIYLFSALDYKEKQDIYKFSIMPWSWEIKLGLFSSIVSFLRAHSNFDHIIKNRLRGIIKRSIFFVDISGYALSSQWSLQHCANYLLNIMIAKKFSVPYYIFPQSIGPFNYRLKDKIFLSPPLISNCLKYPKKIFVREEEGLKNISQFTKGNVEKSYDIVLQNGNFDLSNIYNGKLRMKDIKIEPNSLGIIPNSKVFRESSSKEVYSIYNLLINRLLDTHRKVYILRHSCEDLNICEKIKKLYLDNVNVKLISDDFNAIELGNIIKQFDFTIASRYHSIIHSYRNGVPALVIGWATKYFELLQEFNQLDYFFDIRNGIDRNKITSSLDRLISTLPCEREKINNKISLLVKKDNIFNILN